jgi:HEAT repeat protein
LILSALSDAHAQVQINALRAMNYVAVSAESALPLLLPLLQSSNKDVRNWTVSILGQVATGKHGAFSDRIDEAATKKTQQQIALAVLPLLQDEADQVSNQVISTMYTIGWANHEIRSQLLTVAQRKNVNAWGIQSALRSVMLTEEEWPQILNLLEATEKTPYDTGLAALCAISPTTPKQMTLITELLAESVDKKTSNLLFLIGLMKEEAIPLMPIIADYLASDNKDIQYSAQSALEKIGDPALPILRQALLSEKSRLKALHALANFETLPAALTTEITPWLSQTNAAVRIAALKAIKKSA